LALRLLRTLQSSSLDDEAVSWLVLRATFPMSTDPPDEKSRLNEELRTNIRVQPNWAEWTAFKHSFTKCLGSPNLLNINQISMFT